MRPLPARRLIRILESNGFALARSRGSHLIYKNQQTGTIVAAPLHGGNSPIPIGTFLAIVKQSKIEPGEFA